MPVSPFFQHGSPEEQRLVQSLVDEHLKMFGIDVYYIPRKLIATDDILGEVQSSKFNDNYLMEAYLNNYEGYAKGSDIMTKFGINLQNEITLTISRERFEDFIAPFQFNSTNLQGDQDGDILFGTRPKEGDLIFFPLGERLFEIKHVEFEMPFFQLGKNYTYELQCELFQLQDEIIDTNIAQIDSRLSEEGNITTVVLAGIGSTAQIAVDTFAPSGALQKITLNDDGSGYTTPPSIVVSPSPAGVSDAMGQAVAITTQKGLLNAIDFVAITNPGFAYTEPPTIGFGTPGVGAAATATLTNTGIGSIRISQPGSNYVSAPIITIQHPSDVGIGTTGTVGIKTGQVQATAVGIIQGSVLSSIFLTNAGSGYEGIPTVTVSSPLAIGIGTYHLNERVVGSDSGTEAFVQSWNETTRELQITINTGDFRAGEFITGTASSARYQVLSYTDDLSDHAAGSEYNMNEEFETAADALLDFTESNPFGDV